MSFLKTISSSISSFFTSIFRGIASLVEAFISKFKKPYHSSTLSIRGLLHSVAIAVGIFVVLFLFQPFGIKDLAESVKMTLLISCGIISFISMIICQFIFPLIAKSFYEEHHWNGSKQLIQSLLMSIIISMGLTYFLSSKNIGSTSFPVDGLVLFGFSLIPMILFIFFQETLHDSKFKRKAENLNSDLKSKSVINSDNPLKILVFKGSSEKLSLIPNQLIYAKIDGNVSEFFYQNPFGIDKSVMTIDSKQVLEELNEHPQFVKFSENIILNTNAIQKISGSARGYDIAIAKVNEMVKVSGKFRKNLEKL